MPKLKSFLLDLARKAEFDATTDDVKAFFEGVPDQDVPDSVNTGINNSLLSLTAAKNNHPEIQSHYKAQILAGLDSTVSGIMDELEFDDEAKKEILGEKSSYKRVDKLTKKIKELEAKKGKSKGGDGALQTEIDKLHAQVAAEKQQLADANAAHQAELLAIKIKTKFNSLIAKGTIPTKYDDLDEEIRSMSIEAVINKELQEKGAKLTLDANGNLVLQKLDGNTYYTEAHKALNPKEFVESTLTRNKIIAPINPAPGAGNPLPTPPKGANGAGGKQNAQPAAADYNMQQLERLKNASKVQAAPGMAI